MSGFAMRAATGSLCVITWFLAIDRDAANIVTPTAAQLRYQSTDFTALITFNMGTFAHNGDPCCDEGNWDVKAPYATGKTRDPATFNPPKLNTTQWFESITGLGANIAVLTAKHGCGFLLWPTTSRLPDGRPYGYNVGGPGAAIQHDILQQFVESAKAAGVGYGFYYSIMKSFYLCRSYSGSNSCMGKVLPGQYNLTLDQYTKVATEHVTELWTRYGNLTQIWVDSELDGLEGLMVKLQPEAIGNSLNPTGWCGTESLEPSRKVGTGDIWNTGTVGDLSPARHFGSPDGKDWIPKFCDPQLFQKHIWFWEPDLKVQTLEAMIAGYHDIVGRGMIMELGFSPNRDGLIEDSHSELCKQLGRWVRECYGSPVAMTSGVGYEFSLHFEAGESFDRFQLQEDIVLGQRVRKYIVEMSSAQAADGADGGDSWTELASGQAIGRKRILLLAEPVTTSIATTVRVRLLQAIAVPQLRFFGAFAKCSNGTAGTPVVYV
eukprot:gnl/TRDRNA2_/TRDRNA2_95038_c0_seq1.p1 gnl/TRDRNA2_/TRDRNA2_95038_c0~~gnl/TRDRNA2_/TRDRNA2_95038_c0_seq1.p1  ORF type:complete len:490 (+),score=68.19 gnl/TRDRNA2_/TRDRNA2_95038_c0_seq1:29-1498(+)